VKWSVLLFLLILERVEKRMLFGFFAWVPIPKREATPTQPWYLLADVVFGLGPWLGAQVASQQSPILRTGHWSS